MPATAEKILLSLPNLTEQPYSSQLHAAQNGLKRKVSTSRSQMARAKQPTSLRAWLKPFLKELTASSSPRMT